MTENDSAVAACLGHTIVHYWFHPSINATTSISKFWFEVDEGIEGEVGIYDNGGRGYVIIQDMLIFATGVSARVLLGGWRLVMAVCTQGYSSLQCHSCLHFSLFRYVTMLGPSCK